MPRVRAGIRVQVTAITLIVCFVAMAGVTALCAEAALQSVHGILSHELDERLDAVEAAVAKGDFSDAVDHSGIDLLQAVDASGSVVASTPNVQGFQAITGEEGVLEVDDLELDELVESTSESAHDGAEAGSGGVGSASEGAMDAHFVAASSILATSGPFLLMHRTVDSPDGPITLVGLTSLHLAFQIAYDTARVVAVFLLVLLLFAGVFAWRLTGRTLRPVERMRREVEAISARDLSERVTPPENDPDLSSLALTFNGMLARIQDSVTEQKRFVSDASHELKSPVAATSLMLEAMREHPESVDSDEVLDDLTAENNRLGQIVNDLLMLARQDEGRLVVEKAPVDYCDLLYEETASLRLRTAVRVDDAGVQPVIGSADAGLLSHAVRNVLDNAARYAATTVWVGCCQEDGHVEIQVSDDGPGIPAEDRERVFGRFERLEQARTRKEGSTGLGLPVARGIVERHGGTLSFADPAHGGATAIIRLPLA